MSTFFTTHYQSPIGCLEIQGTSEFISSILFVESKNNKDLHQDLPLHITNCLQQLEEYFTGTRKDFDIPYEQSGTDFQKQAWQSLLSIPYGSTWSYSKQAQFIKNPKAVRAIGHANGQNKLTIIVPCHRVIGADGGLVGYGGTLARKQWLLEHEKKIRNCE